MPAWWSSSSQQVDLLAFPIIPTLVLSSNIFFFFHQLPLWAHNELYLSSFHCHNTRTNWCLELSHWCTSLCHAVAVTADISMQLPKMSTTVIIFPVRIISTFSPLCCSHSCQNNISQLSALNHIFNHFWQYITPHKYYFSSAGCDYRKYSKWATFTICLIYTYNAQWSPICGFRGFLIDLNKPWT